MTGLGRINYGLNTYGNSLQFGGSANLAGSSRFSMGIGPVGPGQGPGAIKNPGESMQVAPGRKSSPAECETCKNRKYQDGSDEMVSFKSAAHISPAASGTRVRAHEQEHVSNA